MVLGKNIPFIFCDDPKEECISDQLNGVAKRME